VTATAYTLAVLLNLLILFIGARFLFQSRPAAYLAIKGLRDATYGVLG
jgi:hypothetical protein